MSKRKCNLLYSRAYAEVRLNGKKLRQQSVVVVILVCSIERLIIKCCKQSFWPIDCLKFMLSVIEPACRFTIGISHVISLIIVLP